MLHATQILILATLSIFTYLIQKFGHYLNEMVIQPDTRIRSIKNFENSNRNLQIYIEKMSKNSQ